jgi:hypothetical protein
VVLGREHDVVHAGRLSVLAVTNGDLDFSIGSQVVEGFVAPHLGQPPGQPVCERDRQRHQLGRLVAGETEHHARVSGATYVHTLRDVGRLLVDAGDDAACFGVEAVLGPRVANLPHRLPDDARDVDIAVGGDLTDDDHKTGGDDRLTRDSSQRILRKDRVQDCV